MRVKKYEITPESLEALNKSIDDPQLTISEKIEMVVVNSNRLTKELELLRETQLTAFHIGNAINDGIYIINTDGIIIDANQSYTSLTGLHRSEILGQHAQKITEAYFEARKAVSIQALEEMKRVSKMSRSRKTEKELLVTANPLYDESGKLKSVMTVIRDVTEINSLRDQLVTKEVISEKYKEEVKYLRLTQMKTNTMIGECPKMNRLRDQINQISQVNATVLITGETGVGKEVVAKEIHKQSPRSEGPYIKVNCAAIPENLIESELFGYEKGAFTGASDRTKLGMFEMADGGTILLDEIGELPLMTQTKLLRVLQEREYFRVGGTTPVKIDVRVIAATNKKLSDEVHKGNFREDLYYRLHVIPMEIPPLRERGADIRLLSEFFLEKFNNKYGVRKYLGIQAIRMLMKYNWPGNVRELENIIERLAVISQSEEISSLTVRTVIGSVEATVSETGSLKTAVQSLEKKLIEEALKETGSTYKAAKILGVNQSTVVRKAQTYQIKWDQDKK